MDTCYLGKVRPLQIHCWIAFYHYERLWNIVYTVALAQEPVVLMCFTHWRLAVSWYLHCHFHQSFRQTLYSAHFLQFKVPVVKYTITSMVLLPHPCVTTPCITLPFWFQPSQVRLSWQFSFLLQQRSQETEKGLKLNHHSHLPFDWPSTRHATSAADWGTRLVSVLSVYFFSLYAQSLMELMNLKLSWEAISIRL